MAGLGEGLERRIAEPGADWPKSLLAGKRTGTIGLWAGLTLVAPQKSQETHDLANKFPRRSIRGLTQLEQFGGSFRIFARGGASQIK